MVRECIKLPKASHRGKRNVGLAASGARLRGWNVQYVRVRVRIEIASNSDCLNRWEADDHIVVSLVVCKFFGARKTFDMRRDVSEV